MTAPFRPAPGPETDEGIDPRRMGRTTQPGERRRWRTAPILAAIALIAAGVVLLWVVTGAIAGADADVIGVAAIALGGIALVMRLLGAGATDRRRRPSVP
jgi:hypothetical protein